MPIKKSDLYSKLWASCDELRGGMDASQYKDYVLVLLFIKYISDKYAGQPFAPIQIPEGASFADMVALKGKSDIGDQINKKIVRPLEEANRLRIKADFNDDALLGQGKEKVDKLTNLIGIFESKDLDFSRHRADGDDILGDAYEYLKHWICSERFTTHSDAVKTTTAIPHISPGDIRSFKVAVPPTIAEQQQIGLALSETDALIDSLEQLLTKKRQIKQGAMQELLTGKRRLPGFDSVWNKRRLGELLSIRHGRDQKQVECDGGEYPRYWPSGSHCSR